MKSMKLASVILSLTLIASASAHAAPIEYVFSGNFDGSLGSKTYSDQAFTVSLVGDTSNVTMSGGEYFNVATSATFNIGSTAGVLGGNFNEVVANPTFSSGVGAVIFGQGNNVGFFGEGLTSSSLSSYMLNALAETNGSVTQSANSLYNTSAGDLVFANIEDVSFEAETLATPLPASFPLFAVALSLLAFVGFNGRRKNVGQRS